MTEPAKPRTTRATRTAEARAARKARLDARAQPARSVDTAGHPVAKARRRVIPRKRNYDPNFMIDPPRDRAPHRPWSVTLGALLAFILAGLFLTRGVQNPSDSSGTGGNGIAFIIIGTVLLGLTTFSLQGRPVARVCLVIPMVAGCVVVLNDDTQPWWLRTGSAVFTIVIAALFLLEPKARTFFGDDASPLHLTKTREDDDDR